MAVTDIIVLATIALSLIFGIWRGLVKEALSLAFWIGAVILAGMFNTVLSEKLGVLIDNPALQRVTAFVLIFVLTVFVGGFVSNLISRLTSAAGLKAVDRSLGALFGLIRGLVIVTLVVMLTTPFEAVKPYYSESRTVPYLMVLAEYLQELTGLQQNAAGTSSP